MPLRVDLLMNQESQLIAEFKLWPRAELQAIIKDFKDPKKDQTKFIEEFRILLGVHDPGLSDLYQFVHMVLSPGDAQRWLHAADSSKGGKEENSSKDFEDLTTYASKDGKTERKKIRLIDPWNYMRVFPVIIDWVTIQSYKHKRDESVADFQICLEEIFRQHSGLRDPKTNIVLSAYFVNGLCPELNDLLKKHKLEWEITPFLSSNILLSILKESFNSGSYQAKKLMTLKLQQL